MNVPRALALLAFAAFGWSCARRIPPPTEVLDTATARVAAGPVDSRTLALAGFHAWLIEGDAEKARARFDLALAQNSAEPWALYGQVLMAARVEQPQRVLTASLDLIERAPHHPLAAVAARLVHQHASVATALDKSILQRAERLLDQGLPGDTSHLLRSALATVFLARDDLAASARLLSDLGVPRAVTLLGPISPWHVLSMAAPTAPEVSGNLDTLRTGPFGPLSPRQLSAADGRFSLSGEPLQGDVFLLAADFETTEAATWVLRTTTTTDHVALIDGARVIERFTWQRPAPTHLARLVRLEPGPHRLLVRLARGIHPGNVSLSLSRLDGRPAALSFQAARGPARRWSGAEVLPWVPEVSPSAADLHRSLLDEAGDALARFVAAGDALGRDRDGARRLVDGLPRSLNGAAVSALRATVALSDGFTPAKVARGRATRELEAALSRDRNFVAAMMRTAQLALDDGRHLDALEQVKAARLAHRPPGAPVLLLQARIEQALGLDAQAVATAREAEAALPGSCDALLLQYDVARRRDAVAESDALLNATTHCEGAPARRAEHLRARGDLGGAIEAFRRVMARDPGHLAAASALASLLAARHDIEGAIALLELQRSLWPRHPRPLKELANLHEQAGRAARALALREQALLFDGADLALRRSVARAKTGKELLEDSAVSTAQALAAYQAAPGVEDVTGAYLLDAAAVQAFADGSQVERVHIIQKALDQQGVSEVAEVNIPQGAAVLKLRTLKPDGTVLEPDAIDGKETYSLPGVQVGDLVEYEYLRAMAPRGPGQPGFTAASFYFQVARQPNNWSTYTVMAPKGSGLKVDAHNMKSTPPKVVGDLEVYAHEERGVRPYFPEPMGPPSANEWLPFVSVGAGQTGNEGTITAYADATIGLGVATWEVEAFAASAAQGKEGVEAVRAVYAAVHEKLSGRDLGLSGSAAASVTQDRGSRTWLLKAALTSLGFDTRLAVVRTFTADPSSYLFPTEGLLPYVCLRVEVPIDGGVRQVWLDPMVRFAPFGELPEFATGEREAWLLPEPGRPIQMVKTPPRDSRPGKEVRLSLTLSEDGALEGLAEETFQGFEAAQFAEALESVSSDQRNQALQGNMSRYFGGAELNRIEVESKRGVGAPVRVRYAFSAKRFGRLEGEKRMVLGPVSFPALLGRRYVVVSSRVTPLFIEATESSRVEVDLTLPPGWHIDAPVGDMTLDCPWGRYRRREQQAGQKFRVEEDFHLLQSRVPRERYEEFGQFTGEVDLLQGRDLLLTKR